MNGYEPAFDRDLAEGEDAELFVNDIIASLQSQRGEVKRDRRWWQTGNLYVETECRRRGEWQPSGIDATSALYYAWVLAGPSAHDGLCLVIPTDRLRQALSELHCKATAELDGSHPTRGFLLPVGKLMLWWQMQVAEQRRAAS